MLTKKEYFKEKEWKIERKKNALAIKKDSPTSIRNLANELKVQAKIVRTAIKQDLSPDHYPLDEAIWGVLENKTNSTFHQNIGSLKTAMEEE